MKDFFKHEQMKRFKVIYKGYAHKTWIEMYKIVTANSKEDAIKKSDLWEGIILKVEQI
jgi:hypothetical protein